MLTTRLVLLNGFLVVLLCMFSLVRAETTGDLELKNDSESDLKINNGAALLTGGVIKLSTGFDYSSGDYGNLDDTEIWYVPVTVSYKVKRWKTKIVIPWVQITGPGGVTGEGEVINPTGTGLVTTESGLGDIVASLTYSFDPFGPNYPLLDVTGKIKFPTADENRGLGSGEFDYTIQGDIYKPLGNLTLLGMLGYKFKGDPPGRDLNNVIKASAGINYKFNNYYSTGLFLDFQEATSQNSDDVVDLFAYLTWKIHKSLSFTGYGAAGFTDGTPDQEFGLQISYKH